MVAWLQPERFARVTSGIKVVGREPGPAQLERDLKERKIGFLFFLITAQP